MDERDIVKDRAMFEEMRDTEGVYLDKIKSNATTALDYISLVWDTFRFERRLNGGR